MVDRKIDRRVSRTRRALKEALLALVDQKGYSAVTIEDITEQADLGRTTFYLHYRDKEDLLMESISELVDDFIRELANIPIVQFLQPDEGSVSWTGGPFLMAFQHAARNETLYRVILRGEGTYTAARRLREIITQAVEDFLNIKKERNELDVQFKIPREVFLNYLATSILGILTWWLEQEQPYGPEEMARMYQKLFFKGARNVIQLNTPEHLPAVKP
ncbi:MAG: TetR/AcrR family transcriptional regulator [Chloroflexi bacterium]|jgi:AcrR family transcriptional regulator|nr:TetR/AcrR family transcriptional regulator [Chloroflexota bacterium]